MLSGAAALHLGCVLLVFAILRRLFRHNAAACVGALVFALHPLQVESVAWVSETRGLLCVFFALLAIWRLLRSLEQDVGIGWTDYAVATAASARRPRQRKNHLVISAAVAGSTAKTAISAQS